VYVQDLQFRLTVPGTLYTPWVYC